MTYSRSCLFAFSLLLGAPVSAGCSDDAPPAAEATTPVGAPADAAALPSAEAPPSEASTPAPLGGPSKSVSGTVLDPEGVPLAGAQVRVVRGGEGTVTSGADGGFRFEGLPSGDVTLEATREGAIPLFLSFWIWTDEELRVDAELYPASEEAAEFQAAYGRAPDSTKGVVFVQFEDRKDSKAKLTGGKAALLAPGAEAFVNTASDEVVPGDTVPVGATSTAVEFIGVPPGQVELTVTPPDGLMCHQPKRIQVVAGAYSVGVASCEPPSE